MTSPDDNGGNVVSIDDGRLLTVGVPRRNVGRRRCLHQALILHALERAVVCRRCGESVDPFEALLMYARRSDRHEAERRAYARLNDALSWLNKQSGGRLSIGARGLTVFANGKSTGRQDGRGWWADNIVSAIRNLVPLQERRDADETSWIRTKHLSKPDRYTE